MLYPYAIKESKLTPFEDEKTKKAPSILQLCRQCRILEEIHFLRQATQKELRFDPGTNPNTE